MHFLVKSDLEMHLVVTFTHKGGTGGDEARPKDTTVVQAGGGKGQCRAGGLRVGKPDRWALFY